MTATPAATPADDRRQAGPSADQARSADLEIANRTLARRNQQLCGRLGAMASHLEEAAQVLRGKSLTHTAAILEQHAQETRAMILADPPANDAGQGSAAT